MKHRLRIGAAMVAAAGRREHLRHERVDALARLRRELQIPRSGANARQVGEKAGGIVVPGCRQRRLRPFGVDAVAPDGRERG